MLTVIDWDAATDEALLDAFRAGDERAYAALFSRHRDFAARVARRHAPLGDVDDVVSEAFTSMLHQVRRGAGPVDNVRAYLAACVRHEAARRSRERARARATDDLRVLDRAVPFGHGSTDVAERQHVATAMAMLTPRQRDVLWSIEVAGLRPREIAPTLGLTANTVSALAYRARRALTAAYARME